MGLSEARHLVDVNESTLRQWADNGFVRSFRTPGGHRRFSREDLLRVVEGGAAGKPGDGGQVSLGKMALRRIRRRLHGLPGAEHGWFSQMDQEGLSRMRLLGRRLVALAEETLGRKGRRRDILAEARLIGEEYGREVVRGGLSLSEGMQAYVFFRTSLLEAFRRERGLGLTDPVRLFQQADLLANQVLLAMVGAYEGGLRMGQHAEARS